MSEPRLHPSQLRLFAIGFVTLAIMALSVPGVASAARLPMTFEVNQGQADARVDFLSRGSGYALFFSPTAVNLSLTRSQDTQTVAQPTVLRMNLVRANPQAPGAGQEELPTKVNDFRGNDRSTWRSDIPTYAKVRYVDVYPRIDLVYYGNQSQLEYDFVVAPQGDPSVIKLDFEGGDQLEINTHGDLIVRAAGEPILQLPRPFIYQDIEGVRHEIPGGFVLAGHQVGFEIGRYDTTRPLVIDPILIFSTHLGGASGDGGQGIAVDTRGNVYVTGDTGSADFPVVKPSQRDLGGSTDVFVAKLSAEGQLIYSTYIGGKGSDVGYAIALDAKGDVYLTGDTRSSDFPVVGAVQQALRGSADIFVAKLSGDGSKLLYSTYHGGTAGERGQAIAVDASGNAAVVGYTQSTDFPTVRPLQASFAGGNADAFVLKLNSSGSALIYSTYLGGGNDRPDIATGVAADPAGNTYVTGFTNAVDFPTVKPIKPFVGPTDVFVTKINPNGSALIYSTHLGGRADDEGMAIAVDAAGSAYVTGETESPDFPTTAGALRPRCVDVAVDLPPALGGRICAGGDAFVFKLNPEGSALVYSTYIVGTNFEAGRGIAVDSAGSAYVTGFTGSSDFSTVNPLQKAYAGGDQWAFDAFVVKLNPAGSALTYSTYLGGRGVDGGYGIAVDAAGNAWVTGITESSDFPVQKALRQASGVSKRDAFVAKVADPAATRSSRADLGIPELAGRLVAVGIPGVGGVSAVGTFHPGGPIHDKPAFQAFTQPGAVLDPDRILVTSSSNFGAPLAQTDLPSGSVLSINPQGGEMIVVPPAFATSGDQAKALDGRVMLFSSNSSAFLNRTYNPDAVTADWAPMAGPTGISLNNAFGRIWITSMPAGPSGTGIESILDPDGRPLAGAPNKMAGGVFTGSLTNRVPQQAVQGSMTSGALATAHLGKSPDGGGRAVFAGLHADGSLIQLHAEKGVDGLAPAGTITPLGPGAPVTRSGMAFNWVPDPILYVADPAANSIVALRLRAEGETFGVETATRLKAAELDVPVDIAPAVAEVASPVFSSNTTLAGGADLYIANRGNGTIVRLKQTGEVVAVRRVTLPGIGSVGSDRLNGIAVSPDASRIWVTVSGSLQGYPEGAVIELPAFGAPGGLSPQ